jgi:hypothetical protein
MIKIKYIISLEELGFFVFRVLVFLLSQAEGDRGG